MTAHELKSKWTRHSTADSAKTEVQSELDRLSLRESREEDDAQSTTQSRQSSYATVQTHPSEPSPKTVAASLNRTAPVDAAVSALTPESPPLTPVASTSKPLPLPAVVNAPGLMVQNSRTLASGDTSPRLVAVPSLAPPHSPSRSHTSPIRSSRQRSSSDLATAQLTSSPRSMHSRHRSQSQVPAITLNNDGQRIQDAKQFTAEPEEMDDVQQSIAAKTEQIKKERAERKAEREREEAAAASTSRQGAPITKRRSTSRPGEGVLVGNLIGQDHANYVLMYNMLTGIRIGVSRCQAKPARPLTDADYTARHKFSFDIVGNELTPSVKYDFKFKDYAPWVFRELREFFYLDPSDYLVSLTAKYILSELGSPGKSGSFFYFSRDYRFIIKTIRKSEHKFLLKILKDYHEHIKANPHTLISRFYGLHRVKLPRGKKIHFVIMNNLFPPHRDIHETYDLKGSSVGRILPEAKAAANPRAILKDLNWINRGRHFALGPEKKALFEEQLRRDTELLQRLGIMDYSLLTGIHNVVRGNVDKLRDGMLSVFQPQQPKMSRRDTQLKRDANASLMRKAVQQSDPQQLKDSAGQLLPANDTSERKMFLFYQDEGGLRATGDHNEALPVIYYVGIIDILTPYTLIKKLEHAWRSMQYNKHQISAVNPNEYGNRFLAFIKSTIVGNDESLRPSMWKPPEEPSPPVEDEKPLADKAVAEKPLGDKPAADKPLPGEPMADKSVTADKSKSMPAMSEKAAAT